MPVISAISRTVAGHALEHRLDRLRADRHDRILDLAGQLLQLFQTHVDRGDAIRIVLDDALRQHGLVDDELADEIDQPVHTIEIDANGRGGGGCGLLGIVLGSRCGGTLVTGCSARRGRGHLDDVGCGFGGGDSLLHGGDLLFFLDHAKRRIRLVIERGEIERNRLHRQFVTAIVCGGAGVERSDLEVAVPFGKFEHRTHGVFALVGLDRRLPGEIGGFRIHLVERWQAVHVAMDAHFAQAREIAQEQRRLIALGIEFRLRLEDDLIGRKIGRFLVVTEIIEGEGDGNETFVIDGWCGGGGNRSCLRDRCDRNGGRRRFALGQSFQLADQLRRACLIDTAAVARDIGQVGQHIRRFQHDLQDILVGFQLVGTNAIKRGLEHVRERDQIIQPERSGTTLDGVDRTENRIHRFRIAVAVIEPQETGFQFSELLLAFLKENLFDFVHIHGGNPGVRRLRARWHRSAWSDRTA